MRLANLNGRAVLVTGEERGLDVAEVSNGQYGPDLASVFLHWTSFRQWAVKTLGSATLQGAVDDASGASIDAETVTTTSREVAFSRAELGCPSPNPRQVVAVGLNYDDHAAESGFEAPTGLPPTFTKFISSLTGPEGQVVLPTGGNTDWEVELVACIGQEAKDVPEVDAWDYVAGLSVGQDLSERVAQMSGPAPQFSLGKSFPKFAPVGPWLVTTDEVANRDDLGLGCAIDGETVQDGRTKDLIYPVPRLISALSKIITLFPGDLIFTGTPAGVGVGRKPQRFLRSGETLTSWIEGIGELKQTFVGTEENGS